MRVDFYQLAGSSVEAVVGAIAQRLLSDGARLLIVGSDEGQLARLDRLLWDSGDPVGFLPHGLAGGADDQRQPVLLSTSTNAANRARNLLIADGEWREAAVHFDRAFYLFDEARIEEARAAWRGLKGREGVERHYWAQEEGRWTEKA